MKHRLALATILFTFTTLAACVGSKPAATPPAPAATEPAPEAAATTPTEPTQPSEPAAAAEPAPPPAPKTASAKLAPASKSKVTGTITFKQTDDGVEATANIENLKPGDHAWHVHEKGDCSAPDATSAGGHFNPENHKHGAPDAADGSAGLRSVVADVPFDLVQVKLAVAPAPSG